MAKFLLALFTVLTVCVAASAQKVSLATNYNSASFKTKQTIADSVNSRPFMAAAKPAFVGYTAVNKVSEADLERELLEKTAALRLQGRQDAKLYYKPKAVFWGTMGTTILYPAAGLATGAVVSVVPPSINDEVNPNAYLMKEPAYEEAFKKQAHRKRFGNAAAGFGAGVAVLGVVYKVVAGGL